MAKKDIMTPDELAEEELNKDMAKEIARRRKDIKRKQAEIKKLEKEIKQIKDGELVPDGDTLSPSRPKQTRVAFLLDESGSMSSCKQDTIEGFNDYVKKLRGDNGHSIKMTFTKFDSSKVDTVFKDKLMKDVPLLNDETYQPGAMTPLLDAIGRTMDAMKRFNDVLFIIQTDGYENASHEYNGDSIKKKIKDFTKRKNWDFVYLGADQDAFLNAHKTLGFERGQTFSYDSSNTKGVFGSGAACYTVAHAAGGLAASDFSLCMTGVMDGEDITQIKKKINKKKKK